jgi:hypothetical protein
MILEIKNTLDFHKNELKISGLEIYFECRIPRDSALG